MASIKQRGTSYLVTVSCGYDGKGKKIAPSKTFKKPADMTDKKWEKEIQKLALEFEKEVQKGFFLDANSTLKDFTERWLKEYANKQLQSNTLESYKYELDKKILPALGHIKLSKLTPVNILSFLNNLMEDGVRMDGRPGGYSNRVIKYQWQILSSILQQAVYWQVIPDNPCRRVKVPKVINDPNKEYSDSKVKFYDETQTLILLELIKGEPLKYQVAVNIAIFCGLRNGEMLGLTWNDIDFKNRTVSINKSRTRTSEGMITKIPKSERSVRVLSIPDILITLLREYKLWQNGEKAKCGDQWVQEWDKYPWLLTQWNGKGMDYKRLSIWLKKTTTAHNEKIVNDSSIPEKEKGSCLLPVLSFHKLRHTSATLLIGENTNIKTVSSRLGHSKTSTTLDIYTHSLRSIDRQASSTLENLLSGGKADLKEIKKA